MANEQVVIITGGSRGFGAAAARLLASRGNTVVATMRNPDRDGPEVVAGYEDRIHPVALDVTDAERCRAVVAEILDRFGRVDALINNAGYGLYGPVEDVGEEELWRQIDTNVLGQLRMMQAVLPAMRAAGHGKIVNVSSLAGRIPSAVIGMYSAVKCAVEAMSESARYELANTGVQVCILEPGMFASDWQTTNLDVAETLREGRSAYQQAADRYLANFRALAATKPGSASVAAAMADIVELEQRLPQRWPVGNDSVHGIPIYRDSSDETWRFLRHSGAFGGWRKPMYAGDPAPPPPPAHDWGSGNVVLITGASRGFGAAAAREIASRSNTVVATMRNPDRDGPAVVEGFEDRIFPVQLDVTDSAAVQRVVAEAIAQHGRIDAVINNAGYGLYGPLEDLTEDEVGRQLDTNFVGQWRVLKAVLPHMRERRTGKIVNVSSLSGQVPSPLMSFYAASKHAVESMSEALAEELEPFGVQVTILEPGMYRSDWQTGNLDVCEAVRNGTSDYTEGVRRALEDFRKLAATRPGSDAVAAAMADIVQLQQPLPLRWPIGNDCIAMIRDRRALSDEEWERRVRGWGWGFTKEEVRRPLSR